MSIEGDREIEQYPARLSREDLAGARAGLPSLPDILSGYSWVRVHRLSSFWRSDSDKRENGALEDATFDLVAGFHGAELYPAFLVLGAPTHLEIWYGLARPAESETLPSALRGALPDIRLSEVGAALPTIPEGLEHGVSISGIPTWKRPENREQPRSDQIERLCRALYGQTWCYAIFAQPQTAQRTREQIATVTRLATDVQSRFLLSTNAADQNNRTAKRLIELLDKTLERLDIGRAAGMWLYSGYLLVAKPESLRRAESIMLAAFSGEDSSPVPLRTHRTASGGAALIPEPISSFELAALMSFPREEYSGYEIVRNVRYGVETNQHFSDANAPVLIGHILDRGQPVGRSLQIARDDLTKHGLIVGVTGAGKTNTCFSLLEQVWNGGQGVPFMVIESAKSEYRALVKSPRFSGLRVFTVGDETISPLRLNPFDVPKGILLQSHIDFLQALFAAAFVLYPPMPYVLAMSIQRVYEDKGWDLAANENRRGPACSLAFPTLDDLIEKVRQVSDAMGYEGEIRSNIKAGLEGRLNQLRIGGGKGIMLNCRESIPSSELFERPCLLELKQLVNDEEKAFLIGLLLIRLHEHYESQGRIGDGKLRHITLIEEAHRLLKNTQTSQGGDTANPQGKAIEVFANLLAEIRAFGEGIFMAEQIPTKLAPEALKNTNLKLIQRLVAKDDREAVGATMNLEDDQVQSLTTLPAGQAVAYLEGLQKPVLVQIPLTETKRSAVEIPGLALRKYMQPFWQENSRLRVRYESCLTCESRGTVCGRPLSLGEKDLAWLQHLWTAIRFSSESLKPAWNSWVSEIKQSSPTGNTGSPFCRAVAWFRPFLERRAEYFGWPLRGTSQVLDGTTSILRSLASEGDWEPPLAVLRSLLVQLEDDSRRWRPYIGCSNCPNACTLSFEVNLSIDQKKSEEFTRAFDAKSYSSLETARMVAKRWIPALLREHSLAMAYCLAASSLHRTNYLPTERVVMLQQFKHGLLKKL